MDTPSSAGSTEGLANADVAPIFTELLELHKYEDGFQEWKEIARWIKYEEDVEEEGNRWTKPHVSTPSLSGWLELRKNLKSGLIMLDVQAKDMSHICDQIVAGLKSRDELSLNEEQFSKLRDLWSKKHRHQFEGPRKLEGNLSRVLKDLIVQKLENKAAQSNLLVPGGSRTSSRPGSRRASFSVQVLEEWQAERKYRDLDEGKVNVALTKKLAAGSEAVIILEGAVNFIEKPVSVLIRMAKPMVLPDLPEVDIPTRFIFLFLGPQLSQDPADPSSYADVGISLATAITDRHFLAALYHAEAPMEIVDALDAYTGAIKILPGDYNTDLNKIEPPAKKEDKKITDEMDEVDEDRRMREQSGLVRSGRPFGQLLRDIKRKKRHYLSDLLDGLHPQCISSFLFLYFACLAPIVAFGGLLGDATENRIATIESLMSGLISGVLFGIFAGQPLIILGSTGPVYVFEKILYQICLDQNWDYLSLRLWIGIWVGAILILLVALDASAYVCYITRFTEELFATLIAFIFIFNALKNVASISQEVKFAPNSTDLSCNCIPPVGREGERDWLDVSKEACAEFSGTLEGDNCDYEPNVFLMSFVLFAGTFTISFSLKNFRNTGYLPGTVRNILSDFAVVIAIVLMSALSYFSEVHTPKLVVPDSFKPTWEGRDWVVTHALIFADHILANPWWVDVFLAPVLALLATILIFMDQQITAVIVNRKENKLQKGCGYHLDLLVLAVIVIICSVFGLPWFVAATVLSINHIQSLTIESESSAPGEKAQFLGIREQRVTAVLIAICIGLSTLITPVLGIIPMPVLFGVFLYMGVSSLKGLQFFDRLLLLFIPSKYQPDYVFLKYVPIHRVHMFTFIQLASLVGLWIIKSHPTTSISFPVMLVIICGIRKLMECLFTRRELRVLDDLLPESPSKGKKRRHGGSFFNRIQKQDWDEEDAAGGKKTKKLKKKEDFEEAERLLQEKKRLRNIAFSSELDDFMQVDPKAKAKHISSIMKYRNRANSVSIHPMTTDLLNPMQHAVGPSVTKFMLFVRLDGQEAYTPISLSNRTVAGLLKRLQSRFPDKIHLGYIGNVYQRNARGLVFHLNDDMMTFLSPNQVFDISVKPSSEDEEDQQDKVDITMTEVEGGIL